jgi:hypothetical protein
MKLTSQIPSPISQSTAVPMVTSTRRNGHINDGLPVKTVLVNASTRKLGTCIQVEYRTELVDADAMFFF